MNFKNILTIALTTVIILSASAQFPSQEKNDLPLMYEKQVTYGVTIEETVLDPNQSAISLDENSKIVNHYLKNIDDLRTYHGEELDPKLKKFYQGVKGQYNDTQLVIDPINLTERYEIFERTFESKNVHIRPHQEWYLDQEQNKLICKIPYAHLIEKRYDENGHFIASVPIAKTEAKPTTSLSDTENKKAKMSWNVEYTSYVMTHTQGKIAVFKNYDYETMFDALSSRLTGLTYTSADGRRNYSDLQSAMQSEMSDTTLIIDPITLEERYEIFAPYGIHDIAAYKIKQTYQYDQKNEIWTAEIHSIMPMTYTRDIAGNLIKDKNDKPVLQSTIWANL